MHLEILIFVTKVVKSIAFPELETIINDHLALYHPALPSALLCLFRSLLQVFDLDRLPQMLLHRLRELIFILLGFFASSAEQKHL